MIKFQVMKGPNMHDEIVFYAFHFLSVEVQPSAGHIHAMHA